MYVSSTTAIAYTWGFGYYGMGGDGYYDAGNYVKKIIIMPCEF